MGKGKKKKERRAPVMTTRTSQREWMHTPLDPTTQEEPKQFTDPWFDSEVCSWQYGLVSLPLFSFPKHHRAESASPTLCLPFRVRFYCGCAGPRGHFSSHTLVL